MEVTNFSDLDLSKSYTYADYLLWKFQERVELFKGKIFKMSPASLRLHQRISLKITDVFLQAFRSHTCEIYVAPFDVRFPDVDGKIRTVVQPDLCVICDLEKLDERGCLGAPDLVVEILSPGNSKKEYDNKYRIYEENGVKEYWIVHPGEKNVQQFVLQGEIFIGLKPATEGEILQSRIFPQLSLSVSELFSGID
ncbi:Uma2 family endonuclease [Cruoricaptor ignavus]|uniref:Uma2 family endonuclease n=1 Tax=Cruoricaptor ignavus TaxID=1118202 RepID=A0A7M1T062_9FLAO|nr:Uma2 family endonuclease [Cruoricaptor ignavus]QOR73230.1 Uma2 family endonuclease [Cruoricaptor ignavus]